MYPSTPLHPCDPLLTSVCSPPYINAPPSLPQCAPLTSEFPLYINVPVHLDSKHLSVKWCIIMSSDLLSMPFFMFLKMALLFKALQ